MYTGILIVLIRLALLDFISNREILLAVDDFVFAAVSGIAACGLLCASKRRDRARAKP